MPNLVCYPSSYDESNYSYASVNSSYPLRNAIGVASDNTTYAEWNLKTGSSAETYVFYKFDCSSIPYDATIDSVECIAKGYISSTSSWYINSRTMQMYYGTSTAKGSSVSLSTNASEQSISCGTWTRAELDDIRIRIYAKRASYSATTTRTQRFYGATLTVTYTLSGVTYTITASASSGGTISPSGSFTASEGDNIEFVISPDDGYSLKSFTVNDSVVQVTEENTSQLENAISLFHFDDEINDSLSNATVTNSGSSLSSGQFKFGANSLYLDGSSYVKIDLGSMTAYTIEFWAYTSASNTSGSYPTLFSSECNSSWGGTYMHVDDGSYSTYPVYRVNDEDPSSNNGTYGSIVFERNAWHHIALCVNGSTHYFFLDGELQATITQSSHCSYSVWYIGALRRNSSFAGDAYFTGYIDEVLISSVCKWGSGFTVPSTAYTTVSSIVYKYTISNVSSNYVVYALFGNSSFYVKKNGDWILVSKVYKKENGQWILQNDIRNLFNESTKYVLKS